jgi:hypothetical protein
MRCGHCKSDNVNVAHVKGCATHKAPVTTPAPKAPARGRVRRPVSPEIAAEHAVQDRMAAAAAAYRAERAAERAPRPTVRCDRCAGTGLFIVGFENDQPISRGECYRCRGTGQQTDADQRRNYGYDNYYMAVGWAR